jgi:hypothetical protein
MDAAVIRGQRRRKAWRRLMKAGRAPVFQASFYWLFWLMLASAMVGCAVGLTIFNGFYHQFFSCVWVR